MDKIKIVTDSTTDLPEEVLEHHQVTVVPLTILIDNNSYKDGVDLNPDRFLEMMRESEELPKTSQPSLGELIEAYEELGKDGSRILSIHMTAGMSGTYKAASIAAEQADADVTVIDSTFIANALGFQVIEAATMASEGKSMDEILERLDHIRKNSKLFVVVSTLENLLKGGRIGRGKAFIGSLLKLKPIAALEDGVYTPVTKVRTQNQVIQTLMNHFKQDTEGKEVKGVSISHANGLELAHKLREKLSEHKVSIQSTTPVISTHTGEGAIGFTYYTD
ncbi:DegV family protein [Geomicrobium sediminis]|uniref:DegV family protein with EDD domain n=1 Tax=Geomicrobium sediminis TaxID=1347788 RepID=A0ABS2PAM2_9BACL|nr:DegV family protein [Geomicrobium sediminis]MBM7632450.1 DegV family protein with EDD domain [Geomicrobium sediminis]